MRCATFVEQKENATNCEGISQILERLLLLILNKSSRVRDFASLLNPKLAHGEEFMESLALIFDDLLDEPDEDAESLFRELKGLHNATEPMNWPNILGAVVECAFAELTTAKYKRAEAIEHHHECQVNLSFEQAKFSTNKPIDVIVWTEKICCGEFIEVKKNITTLRGRKISKKVGEMRQLKIELDSHTHQESFVGFGTLAIVEEPADGHLLSLLGYTEQDRQDADLRLRVVNFNSLYKWLDMDITKDGGTS